MSKLLQALRSSDSETEIPADPTAKQIQESLKKSKYRLSRIERISGGNANFTYRGWLKKPEKGGNETVIVKHAEPFLASNKEWEIDVGRADFERFMIETLSDRPPTKHQNFSVRTPRFLSPEAGPHTMLIEDLTNAITVKEYLSKNGDSMLPSVAKELGIAIGTWLKNYHKWLNGNDAKAVKAKQRISGNRSMVEAREQLYIGSYRDAVKQFPNIRWPSEKQLAQIEADVKKVCREGRSGIHGDFWTGNMILRDKPLASQTGDMIYPTKIFVIDFEVSQLGSRPQDLAQCLAELYMVHHFYGAQAPLHVMKGVISGYFSPDEIEDPNDRSNTKIDPKSLWTEKDRLNFALNTAMHFGVHVVVIPHRFGWPKGDRLVSCARLGNDFVVNGHDGNSPFFKGGPLHDLFPSFPPPPKVTRTEAAKKPSLLRRLFCACF